jgi:hypothetical protein
MTSAPTTAARDAAPASWGAHGAARGSDIARPETLDPTQWHWAGTSVAILSETQSRPVLVQLSELAAHDLGADFCMIRMPTPPSSAPVPVKSTGTSWAIHGNRAVVEALKRVEVIVDCTVEGIIHAPELRIPTHPVGRSNGIRSAVPGYPVTAR